MKTLKKYIALPLVLLTSCAYGWWGGDNNCGQTCAPVTCCVAPLQCGGFNFEVKGGVAPIHWTKSGRMSFGTVTPSTNPCSNFFGNNSCEKSCDVSNDCSFSNDCSISNDCSRSNDCGNFNACGTTSGSSFNGSRLPSFGRHHSGAGWAAGLKLGYALCNNVETFLEVDFVGSSSKCESSHGYRFVAGFWGWRYYTDRCWNCVSFFVGSKIGIAHLRPMCIDNRSSCLPCPITLPNCFGNGSLLTNSTANVGPRLRYQSSNVVAGGAHIGFDARVWSCLSFVFTAEVLALGAMRHNHQLFIPAPLVATTTPTFARFGNHGTQVVFPITFGLKWDF
jgi:hypothetical protein